MDDSDFKVIEIVLLSEEEMLPEWREHCKVTVVRDSDG